MIYFPEYMIHDSKGNEVVPYLKNGKWYIYDNRVPMDVLGIMCHIDEEELIMLKLTYGG